jgi:hypothetical protein
MSVNEPSPSVPPVETQQPEQQPEQSQQSTPSPMQQIQKILEDEGLAKFVEYIRGKDGPGKIYNKLNEKVTPEFTREISNKLQGDNDEEYVRRLIDTMNIIFAFILYSSVNRVSAKKILDEFKRDNPDVDLGVLNILDSLSSKGVNSFLTNLQYLIEKMSEGDYTGFIDLVVYTFNNLFEYLSIKNEKLVGVIDIYLQVVTNILLFNPATGPILRLIGVGVAPFIAYQRFSDRNREELDEVTRYLTEMTPSSEERAKSLLEDAKNKGYKDRIMLGLGELKRSLNSAKITLRTRDITGREEQGEAVSPDAKTPEQTPNETPGETTPENENITEPISTPPPPVVVSPKNTSAIQYQ